MEYPELVEEVSGYGIREGFIYESLPRQANKRELRGVTKEKTQDDKRNKIVEHTGVEIVKGRPVVIITNSEEEIEKLSEKLKGLQIKDEKGNPIKPRILEYTAASQKLFEQDLEKLDDVAFEDKYGIKKKKYKSYQEFIKKESGKPGVITLGTQILGRGTTIKDQTGKRGSRNTCNSGWNT